METYLVAHPASSGYLLPLIFILHFNCLSQLRHEFSDLRRAGANSAVDEF